MKIDFHVHTNYSPDSIIKPEDLARKSKRLGIIPAITDHNTVKGNNHLRSLDVEFIPGEEIRTDRGDVIGLYLNEAIPKYTRFSETLDKIHEQGGIAYLPHMYETIRHGALPDERDIPKIDIIEVFNARCLEDSLNRKAENFATENRKLKAVGSDSHFLFEFGNTYAELHDFDLGNPKELLKALRKPHFVTKKAPLFVRGPTKIINIGKKIMKISGLRPNTKHI